MKGEESMEDSPILNKVRSLTYDMSFAFVITKAVSAREYSCTSCATVPLGSSNSLLPLSFIMERLKEKSGFL
jgi:hypothetical protein